MHDGDAGFDLIKQGVHIIDHQFDNGGAVGGGFAAAGLEDGDGFGTANRKSCRRGDDFGELRGEPVGRLPHHPFVKGHHGFDIPGDQAD